MAEKKFLSSEEQEKIVSAIRTAEKKTTGEIKVYFEQQCRKDLTERTMEIFHQLHMHETAQQTGVLIYVAYEDHLFSIIGDKGIHEKVPENFWDDTKNIMLEHFTRGEFTDGLVKGINLSGEHLKKYFAAKDDNPNEVSDDIVFGDE